MAKFTSIFRKILIGLGVLLVLIQFVPFGRSHTNPPTIAEPQWDSPQTRETFFRSCGDCHSNQMVWPWYSNVAPVSWLVQYDVEEGRSHLNVSEWGRRKNDADEAVEEVESGAMPYPPYLLLHPSARLSDNEKAAFLQGLKNTFGQKREADEHEAESESEERN
ncbi:MAG: heme-binding domain-containing protein [Bacteroidota bacterium]